MRAALVTIMFCLTAWPAHAVPSSSGPRIDCTFDGKSDLVSKVFVFPGEDGSTNGETTVLVTTRFKSGEDEFATAQASGRPVLPFQINRKHPPAYRPLIFIGEGAGEHLDPSLDGQQYEYVHTALVSGLYYDPATSVQSEKWTNILTRGECLLKTDGGK